MIRRLRLSIPADDCVHEAGLVAEGGLSVPVAADGFRLLLDTGQGHGLVRNAACMGCSPENLDAIVTSHARYDDSGKLAHVLHPPGQPAGNRHAASRTEGAERKAERRREVNGFTGSSPRPRAANRKVPRP